MNNQVSIGTIAILDSPKITVTENTVLKPKYELYVRGSAKYSIVTKNTFKNCYYGVYGYKLEDDLGRLKTFSGNKYK